VSPSDVVRIAIVVLYAFVFGQAVWVMWTYRKVHLHALKKGHRAKGIRSLHVLIVGGTHLFLGMEVVVLTYTGHTYGWWPWLTIPVLLLSNFGLWIVLGSERRRYARLKETP
jgi:hypothetical protein